jgi:TolA-binding protein
MGGGSRISFGFCVLFLAFAASLPACSSAPKSETSAPDSGPVARREEAAPETPASMSDRVRALEEKIAALNEKLTSTQLALDNYMGVGKPKPTPVKRHPGDLAGQPIRAIQAPGDPEAGFSDDKAVDKYREARILFDAERYPDAILGFAAFVREFPDHPLAGAAQFYVGESYYLQKEHKLALEEYRRVLASYGRSSHVAETLKRVAEVEEMAKLPQEAERHRHMLLSLFPQSPAAKALLASAPVRDGAPGAAMEAAAARPAPEAAENHEASDTAPIDTVPEAMAPETVPETAEPEH